jgi:hypothetical protein
VIRSTNAPAALVVPDDYALATATLPFLGAEYVGISTNGRLIHLAAATRLSGGLLDPAFSTLCGKETRRMRKHYAQGKAVTCRACLDGLAFRLGNDEREAAAHAAREGADRDAAAVEAVVAAGGRFVNGVAVFDEAPVEAPVDEFVSAEVASVGGDVEVLRGLAVVGRPVWKANHLAIRTGDLSAADVTLCGYAADEADVLDGDRHGVTCSTCVGAAHARRAALVELDETVVEAEDTAALAAEELAAHVADAPVEVEEAPATCATCGVKVTRVVTWSGAVQWIDETTSGVGLDRHKHAPAAPAVEVHTVAADDDGAREIVAQVEEAATNLFAYSPATQAFGEELAAREAELAQAARRDAVDAAVREADHRRAYGAARATDRTVLALAENGEIAAAHAVATSLADAAADRAARRRNAERRGIAAELVNVEGGLDEHNDGAVARDVLDLFDRTGDLVRVGEDRREETGEIRRLVAFKANAAERADLDEILDYLRAERHDVATASDALRHVVGLYAALVRASADARL